MCKGERAEKAERHVGGQRVDDERGQCRRGPDVVEAREKVELVTVRTQDPHECHPERGWVPKPRARPQEEEHREIRHDLPQDHDQ